MHTLRRNAFTLVELLIVIGIIGLLAVTVLLTLNPAEAQRKSRDTKRIRDASTLQAAIEQLINEGDTIPTATGAVGSATGAVSSVTGTPNTNINVTSQNCASGSHWLGAVNLCQYIKTVPLDPMNGTSRNYQNGTSGTTTGNMFYRARINGSDYEIGVRQESTANVTKITGDGGDDADWFEVFGGVNTLL